MPSIGARQARPQGRRLGRRRSHRSRAARAAATPAASQRPLLHAAFRCSTPSTSRSSQPAASSTAAGWPPRCPTAQPGSPWGRASSSPRDSSTVPQRGQAGLPCKARPRRHRRHHPRRRHAAPDAAYRGFGRASRAVQRGDRRLGPTRPTQRAWPLQEADWPVLAPGHASAKAWRPSTAAGAVHAGRR